MLGSGKQEVGNAADRAAGPGRSANSFFALFPIFPPVIFERNTDLPLGLPSNPHRFFVDQPLFGRQTAF